MSGDSSGLREGAPNWRAILFAVCVAQAFAIVGFDFALPFVPLYLQHDLGLHGLGNVALWSGLIGFGPAIPATIFGPIWGRVADRYGYRTMLLRAMSCAAILLALMGTASSPGVLLALRIVQGALTGTIFSAQALVAASVPERETGRSMGLLQMSVFVGATMGPVGGGAIAGLFGYRAAYVAAGILLGLGTLVVLFFVREPQHRARERRTEAPRSMASLLAIRGFAIALGLTLSVQFASTALLPIVPLFVQTLLHSAQEVPTYTGWLMAVSGLCAGAGSYIAGRLQRHTGVRPLLVVCIVLSAALVASQALSGNYLAFLTLRSITAFAFGGLVSLVGMIAATQSPREAKGAAFGMLGAASSMGFGAGPLLGGALVGVIGIRPVFVMSGSALILLPLLVMGAVAVLPAVLRSVSLIPERER